MTLEDFYFISQIAAALGIMASLVFVGLQVRQSNAQAKADAAEATHRAMIDWYYNQTPTHGDVLTKAVVPDAELSDRELFDLFSTTMPLLMNMQEAHIKWVAGSLEESRWEFWDNFSNILALSPWIDIVWHHRSALFTERFRNYFQGKLSSRDPQQIDGRWYRPVPSNSDQAVEGTGL